ncbi:MAG: hypothetical protein ACFCGT_25515 [Sandaracinaceae bacterium]
MMWMVMAGLAALLGIAGAGLLLWGAGSFLGWFQVRGRARLLLLGGALACFLGSALATVFMTSFDRGLTLEDAAADEPEAFEDEVGDDWDSFDDLDAPLNE